MEGIHKLEDPLFFGSALIRTAVSRPVYADRFIPSAYNLEAYHMGNNPESMTREERIQRQQDPTRDIFQRPGFPKTDGMTVRIESDEGNILAGPRSGITANTNHYRVVIGTKDKKDGENDYFKRLVASALNVDINNRVLNFDQTTMYRTPLRGAGAVDRTDPMTTVWDYSIHLHNENMSKYLMKTSYLTSLLT